MPLLNPHALMEEAVRITGLCEWGDAPLHEGLDRLCRSLDTEADLNEAGKAGAVSELTGALVERLKIEDYYRRHREIDEQQVIAPIMVMGLPRTGTTALSHMLSTDPGNRSIRRWEAAHPTPPPHPSTEANDSRRVDTQRMLDKQYEAAPEMMAMNPITVNDPTENLCFLRLTFQSFHFPGFYNIPSYMEWVLTCDMEPCYRYFLRVLKLLQVNYPGQKWNLKYPFDLFSIEAITAVFPDAHLVWTHRDPIKAVPSSTSLIYALRRPFSTHVDKAELGRREVDKRVEQLRCGMAYRGRPDAKPIINVFNSDLVRNPVETIRKLYDEIGRDLTPDFEAALRRYIDDRPIGRFGAHNYTLEEFGMSETELAQRFQFYTSAFAFPKAK